MKKILLVAIVLSLCFNLAFIGCGKKKAAQDIGKEVILATSKEAIDKAKTLPTIQEKINYLINQANAFYNAKEFQKTIDVAQYLLRYLNKDSQEAKSLLEKAKNELVFAAKVP